MSLKCKLGFHLWNGCKCSVCGKIRDDLHDWKNNCEKCSICGKTRENQHDLSQDCEKCSICGEKTNNQHVWGGCKCIKCGEIRDEEHNWTNNCERCSSCGKIRSNFHDWSKNQDECSICRMPNNEILFEQGCIHMVNALRNGDGTKAIQFLEFAAIGGHTEAKNMLGILLLVTGGNMQNAYKWICEAANDGNEIAISNRSQMKNYMNPTWPGTMVRFDLTWGEKKPEGAPTGFIQKVPYRS